MLARMSATDATTSATPQGAEAELHMRFRALVDELTPSAIRVAATLGLAKHMTDGPLTLEELAEAVEVDADALGGLLRYLSCRGVFAEPEPDVFVLTELAEFLREDHPAMMHYYLDLEGVYGRTSKVLACLLDVVRSGEPAYLPMFGRPFFDDLDERGLSRNFADEMAGPERLTIRDVFHDYNWEGVEHIVDVGGGSGRLLSTILKALPDARGTLVDRPANAGAGSATMMSAGVAHRCEIIGQSFFDALPGGGDVYLLSCVLVDWNDDEAVALLKRCRVAGGQTGRLLIVDKVRVEGENPSTRDTHMDLFYRAVHGGKHRTFKEHEVLAAAAGFTLTDVGPADVTRRLLQGTVAE